MVDRPIRAQQHDPRTFRGTLLAHCFEQNRRFTQRLAKAKSNHGLHLEASRVQCLNEGTCPSQPLRN